MPRKSRLRRTNRDLFLGRPPAHVAYQTASGRLYLGVAEDLAKAGAFERFEGRVQLVFTSPPFPLNRKKKYGNLTGEEYIDWLAGFGSLFRKLLTADGSIVIELGNSWQTGLPTMSTLAMRALLRFMERNDLHLCQEFVWYNPSKLPTPAQWVTVERIRVKDNFTKLWWLSPTPKPKAHNREVLQPYSSSMDDLLEKKAYNSGKRPSEHHIGRKSFLKNNGGSIPGNVIIAANTNSNDAYHRYCRQVHVSPHPARMPAALATFFINFLTDPHDIVFDPFAGSNTTGAAAESAGRCWVAVESIREYVKGSRGRFA